MISGHRVHLYRIPAAIAIFVVAAAPWRLAATSTITYPYYTAQSIVHAATQTVQALAPNTIATIYGTNLAFDTLAATVNPGGTLPTDMDGVSVNIGGGYANLFFISPTQINFLVPYQLVAGPVTIVVERQAAAGPSVQVQLNATAPGLFVYNGFVIATHLNGTLCSAASPAVPGEIIVIYTTSLGRVNPDTGSGRMASFAATMVAASQLEVLLAGTACPPGDVLYAGLAPGFAGLYQVNLIVPALTPPNPSIQISVGPQISQAGVLLAVQ
jgi:uncharacterized protein (TIGR03437 family)